MTKITQEIKNKILNDSTLKGNLSIKRKIYWLIDVIEQYSSIEGEQ
jgi:hypothetical protein